MTDIVERLRAPAYWISGSSEGHEGDNSAPLEAADEIERLRAALRWYADEHNYLPRASAFGDGVYAPHVITDNGWNARAALAEEKQ